MLDYVAAAEKRFSVQLTNHTGQPKYIVLSRVFAVHSTTSARPLAPPTTAPLDSGRPVAPLPPRRGDDRRHDPPPPWPRRPPPPRARRSAARHGRVGRSGLPRRGADDGVALRRGRAGVRAGEAQCRKETTSDLVRRGRILGHGLARRGRDRSVPLARVIFVLTRSHPCRRPLLLPPRCFRRRPWTRP